MFNLKQSRCSRPAYLLVGWASVPREFGTRSVFDLQTLMKRTLLLATLCVLGACATARAADVKEIWDKQCAKCHGADGKGDTKMGKKLEVKDYTSAKVQAEMTDAEMTKIIKEGK